MTMRIYLEDECPRIGSGWRTVEIKMGRKWAHLIDTANGHRARLPKDEAERIIEGSSKWSNQGPNTTTTR